MTLRIRGDTLALIHSHGEAAYPEEGAGFLLGVDGTERVVMELMPLPNAGESEGGHKRFLIRPEEYMRAELAAERRHLDLVGLFHSHPDHASTPSDYDKEWAQPFFSYVITRVAAGKAIESKSWRLAEDRSRLVEENLGIID
jgi:proteasome lid subunit RPN8/RPN11